MRQINLHRSTAPSELLSRSTIKTMLHPTRGNANNSIPSILLISEPPSNRGKVFSLPTNSHNIYFHKTNLRLRSCILVQKNLISWPLYEFMDCDITSVLIQGLNQRRVVVCSYYSDITKKVDDNGIINRLSNFCNDNDLPLIIGCDSNSHSSSWGCKDTNRRGHEFDDLILSNNLIINNMGSTPTFVSHLGESIIDITMTNAHASPMISDWYVDINDSLSDHRYIEYKLLFDYNPSDKLHRNWKKADWPVFTKLMQEYSQDFTFRQSYKEYTRYDIDSEAKLLNDIIYMNMNIVCPEKKAIGRDPQPWWTKEMTTLRKDLRRVYRILTRKWPNNNGPSPERKEQLWSYYREGKKELKKIIQKSKRASWRDFCSNVTYRDLSRLVKNKKSVSVSRLRKEDGTLTESPEEIIKLLFDIHIPGHTQPRDDEPWQTFGIDMAEDIIIHDHITSLCINSFGKYKAPGPDGIPAVVLQHLDPISISKLTQLYNAILYTSYTPKAWRESKVIFISKPGKDDYTNPRAYRPITLSNVILKVLEKLMTWHNKATTNIERLPNQLGFRAGYSTEDALSRFTDRVESGLMRGRFVVTCWFDVQGAFNHLQFHDIFNAFSKLGVNCHWNRWYQFYLRNRTVYCDIQGQHMEAHPTQGGSQGGIGTPQAWNSAFQDGLEVTMDVKDVVDSLGYADDINKLTIGHLLSVLLNIMQQEINKLSEWTKAHHLKLCPNKTKAMIFTRKRFSLEGQKLTLDGQEIEFVSSFKYLGVTFDPKLTFHSHTKSVANKAKTSLMSARKVISKQWGLSPQTTRWLYTAMVRPMMSYGALVWSARLSQAAKAELLKVQRLSLMMITGASRSTPTATLEVICHIMPLDLHLQKVASSTFLRIQNQLPVPKWDQISHKKFEVGHQLSLKKSCADLDLLVPTDEYVIDNILPPKIDYTAFSNECFVSDAIVNENSGTGWYQGPPNNRLSNFFWTDISNRYQNLLLGALDAMNAVTNSTIYISSEILVTRILFHNKITKLEKETRDKLRMQNCTLRWDPSRKKEYNIATRLAKKGAETRTHTCFPHFPISQKNRKFQIERTFQCLWHRKWKNQTLKHSKFFIHGPDIEFKNFIKKLNRKSMRTFTQAISGHSNMVGSHKIYYNISDTAECTLCLENEESVIHWATDCPALEYWRIDNPLPPDPGWDRINYLSRLLSIAEVDEAFSWDSHHHQWPSTQHGSREGEERRGGTTSRISKDTIPGSQVKPSKKNKDPSPTNNLVINSPIVPLIGNPPTPNRGTRKRKRSNSE